MSNTFRALAGLRPYQLREGVFARAVNGERMTLAVVDLEPGSSVPEHHHENEQLGFILRGSMTFTIGGEKRVITAGDTYTIPSNVPHDALAGPEGCTAVDAFVPVRADWEKLDRLDPFPPEWPLS
ncbi:MAG TPA: cupin domain-containing protein [Candidatus Limnocylindrales bacterium]|nr:cupin domain-containing protein [Candidatus Limnocylindrales bacterium]